MKKLLAVLLMLGLATGATLLTSCEDDDGDDWQTLFAVTTDLGPDESLDHAFIATTNGTIEATVDWEQGGARDVWLAWTREAEEEEEAQEQDAVGGEPPLHSTIRVVTGERVRVELRNLGEATLTFDATVRFLAD